VPARHPERIVCLTEETTETLYLLGEERRIVGVSGYTVRPPRARREKPRVSAFLSARIDKILELKPDLVLGFSDLQADISKDLVKAGLNVVIFNQRSVEEILSMILVLSSIVGAGEKGLQLVKRLEDNISEIRNAAKSFPRKPRVYFEEWDEPMISGIRWVSELIEIAGGVDVFSELSLSQSASGRIIADPQEVVRRKPDVIIGSWCGKKFRPERLAARPGWGEIPALQEKQLYEIKSADILQPGPAALTDGVKRIHEILKSHSTNALNPRRSPVA
jgi:iron complex transport system substrate-binding protein